MTNPDWVPIIRRAGALVTDSGGMTCHAAIVSRELGVPCVVGTRTRHDACCTTACSSPSTPRAAPSTKATSSRAAAGRAAARRLA